MRRRTAAGVLAVLAVLAAVGLVAYGMGLVEYPGEDRHDRARVTFVAENGTELASVEARVADTRAERMRGLSDAESRDEAFMLFVHGEEAEQTYVMRDMDVPLDIVFVDADGVVTTVHGAPVPPDDAGDLTEYEGRAKWVVELPRGFADEHGIEPGVEVRVEFLD